MSYTIIAAISSVIYQIVSSFTASVGNLLVEKNYEKNFYIYKKINMLNSFITGISICIFCTVITPFIKVWIGDSVVIERGLVIGFAVYTIIDMWSRIFASFASIHIPLQQSIITKLAKENYGSLMGIFNSSKAIGQVTGSLTAGFIFDIGNKLPFLISAILVFISFIVLIPLNSNLILNNKDS